MSEADFTGMDAGEYYAMRDFEARERSGSREAELNSRICSQREQIKKLDKALSIACSWLEQAGSCTHFPGYLCDKEFSKKGVCAACLRRHLLGLAREGMKK